MKIKITTILPIANPPEIGTIHEVTRRETEPPRHKRTRMYFIEVNGREIGVYPRECEKSSRLGSVKHGTNGSKSKGYGYAQGQRNIGPHKENPKA